MDTEEAFNYLIGIDPFQNLDEVALRQALAGVSEKSYPKGATIRNQEEPAPEYLWIIKKGAVKIYLRPGKESEIITDYRGEGECFGFLSLMHGEKSMADIVTTADTFCYLMEKETLLSLLKNHSVFAEYFFLSVLNNHLEKPYRQRGTSSFIFEGRDRRLFTTPVGQLITRDLVGVSQDISIKEAGEFMSRRRTDYLLLLDADGLPAGIITDKDLRDKVVAKARNVDQPVSLIKSVSLVKADAKEDCAEALFKMMRYTINHLLVIENGKVKGVINSHDLIQFQGGSPLSLVREIEDQQSLEGLAPLPEKINKMTGVFLGEGAKAAMIVQMITELSDRIIRKVLEITERKSGKSPLPYVWLTLGSGGRKEQTLKSGQNHALVFDASPDPLECEKASRYFSDFFRTVGDSLARIGLSGEPHHSGPGEVLRCQSLVFWKKDFSVRAFSRPGAALKSILPFFDGRPLWGKMDLYESFRKCLNRLLGVEDFFHTAAWTLVQNPAPITWFKNFVVEQDGKYKDLLNLKVKGLRPLIDLARLLSLDTGIEETATLNRFQALKERSALICEHGEELEFAFEFFTRLRLQHRFDRYSHNQEMHDYIEPGRLNLFHKKTLKEALGLIARLQDRIREKYGLSPLQEGALC